MIDEERKNQIKQQLLEGEVVVEFTKLNGDYRKMTCTLQEGAIPVAEGDSDTTHKPTRAENTEVCAVYDVNAQGWRSFRWDSVIDAKLAHG